jgi:hypothetical protein
MPANCFWDDEAKTLYCVHMTDEWVWDDFTNAITETYAYLGKLDFRMDFVMGFFSPLPQGSALAPLTYAGEQPPTIRHTVFVNATGKATTLFISSLIQAVDDINEWQGPKFVDSMEQARDYLAQQEK